MFVTCPIFTPRNSTGEPIDSPVIEPEKYITQVNRFWKNLPEPKTVMPSTASATAPTTKAPIIVLFGCLAMSRYSTPAEKGDHPGVFRFGQELLRVAGGDRGLALSVQENGAVPD